MLIGVVTVRLWRSFLRADALAQARQVANVGTARNPAPAPLGLFNGGF